MTAKPLVLPNRGNTCFLASATQLLYAAYFHSLPHRCFLHSPASEVGQALEHLFKTRAEREWDRFVDKIFRYADFVRGQPDDSGEAFIQIANIEWPKPGSSLSHAVSFTFYETPECHGKASKSTNCNNFIEYSGPSDWNSDIAAHILNQHSQRNCLQEDCDGQISEQIVYDILPDILFLVGNFSPKCLTTLLRGLIFPPVKGGIMTETRYTLIGASIRTGASPQFGHYTSLVLYEAEWWSCSDDRAHVININTFSLQKSDLMQLVAFKKL